VRDITHIAGKVGQQFMDHVGTAVLPGAGAEREIGRGVSVEPTALIRTG